MINLSSKDFTKAEFKTLGYNLNFIPTPGKPNKKPLEHDIKQFSRRIKLRDHFGTIFGPLWDDFEDHFGMIFGLFWDNFGTIWDHFGFL